MSPWVAGWGKAGAYLEGCEPHEPVEAVVVGGDEARPPPEVARLALELVVLPHSVWCTGVGAGRALQDDLRALPGDAVGETESGQPQGRRRLCPRPHPALRPELTRVRLELQERVGAGLHMPLLDDHGGPGGQKAAPSPCPGPGARLGLSLPLGPWGPPKVDKEETRPGPEAAEIGPQLRAVPSKGAICVDDSEGVEGAVHDLLGAQ